jgi:predicted GNAT superfamily acetyltransferase
MRSRIRDLISSDLGAALEINQTNTPEVGSVDSERLAFLFDEAAIALAAVDGVAVLGFVLVLAPGSTYDSVNYRWFTDRGDNIMYLDRVVVDAGHRGMGLGRALYSAVFDRIGADHPAMTRLGLEVNIEPPNPASMAFHRKLGFEEVGQQQTPYGSLVSLMERAVTSDR